MEQLIGILFLTLVVALMIFYVVLKNCCIKFSNKHNPKGTISKRVIRNNQAIGYITSRIADNKIYIGYSLCDKEDIYSSKKARDIAFQRSIDCLTKLEIPRKIEKDFNKFLSRCCRYYKGKEFAQYFEFKPSNKVIA